MKRFIALPGGSAVMYPLAAVGQEAALPLIGIINAGSAALTAKGYEAFRNDLRQLGYAEGRNIRYEYRFADGFLDRLPRLAEELVQLNPQVIVSAPMPTNVAVHKATKTIPIVMSTGADPVGFGLVQSLSRPGGARPVRRRRRRERALAGRADPRRLSKRSSRRTRAH